MTEKYTQCFLTFDEYYLTNDINSGEVTMSINEASKISGISAVTMYNRYRRKMRELSDWSDLEIAFIPVHDNRTWNRKKEKSPLIGAEARKEKQMFDMRKEFLSSRLL